MRAVRYHEGGDPSVLRVDEVERPDPSSDEILVNVRAASINPTDAKRRSRGTGPTPKTTGSDFAGVVEAIGSDVSAFEPSDRVCGTGLHTKRFRQGSFADYVTVPTDIITALPDGVSFEYGAAAALVGVTAWRGLIDHGGLEPTDACLIHGGTGGVGHMAVQLSNLLRAHTVATANPDRKSIAEDFGADEAVSYERDDLFEAVTSRTDDGFDVIFDHRASEYFTFDIEAATFDGTIVHYSDLHGEVTLSPIAQQNNLSMHAMTMSNLATADELPSVADVLARVLDLVDDGDLAPHIVRTYDLKEAAEVHRTILEDSYVGKLVVVP